MIKPPVVKLFAKLLILLTLLVLTLLAAKGAFGATSSTKHNNGLGVVMSEDNPMAYIEGNLLGASPVEHGINIRLQPRGVYQLYTQDILFCDIKEVIDAFKDREGVVVLTYDRVAHRRIDGVGCHDLYYVDEVK